MKSVASCLFGDYVTSDQFLRQFFHKLINIKQRDLFEQCESLVGHALVAIGGFFKNDLRSEEIVVATKMIPPLSGSGHCRAS